MVYLVPGFTREKGNYPGRRVKSRPRVKVRDGGQRKGLDVAVKTISAGRGGKLPPTVPEGCQMLNHHSLGPREGRDHQLVGVGCRSSAIRWPQSEPVAGGLGKESRHGFDP